jgi:hypothetical protein
MSTATDHWWEQLRPLFGGRSVIVKHEVVAGALPTVHDVRRLGATDVLVVATGGTGTGPLPTPREADWCSFDVHVEGDMVAGIHAGNRAMAQPPEEVVRRIERFDPDRSAVAVADFLNGAPALCGRPFLAHRRPEWLALDDKTVVDALWDRCGVERAPSEIVDAAPGAVRAAMSRVDRGDGVVVNADAAQGWTGGGSGVRWVRTGSDVDAAVDGWCGPGRRIRVMPFLEGVPCSVHGIVLPDAVIALRPVEMVTLRRPDGGLFYVGCATFWDPPRADRETMRELARQVGAHLRTEVAYRGAFTIDGVMTRDGFRPTELNPRNGAGLNMATRGTDVPLQLLLDAITAGIDADWRPRDLERHLLHLVDRERRGGTWRAVTVRTDALTDERLAIGDVRATWSVGPSALGSFFRAMFDASTFPRGRPAGPAATEVWAYWNERYALGLPPLRAAPDVRTA